MVLPSYGLGLEPQHSKQNSELHAGKKTQQLSCAVVFSRISFLRGVHEVPLPGEVGKENLSSSQRSLVLPELWKSSAILQNKEEVQEINIISH